MTSRRVSRGISKVSVQTGTSHGGVPLPDGGVAEVKLDFEVLRELGVVAREYGLAGAVQHGASTLPDSLFHRFPEVETAEIHLATGFQNALYEHPGVPRGAPPRDRGLVLRERARRAQGRPDGPAVRLHDPQEGHRAVQAAAVGPRREGRRSWPHSGSEGGAPVPRAPGGGDARAHRPLRPACRAPSPAARRLAGRRHPLIAGSGHAGARISHDNGLTQRGIVVDAPQRGAILPAIFVAGWRDPRRMSPATRVTPRRSVPHIHRAEVGGEIVAGTASPEDVAARDDAQLRSLGIKPELKRTPRLPVELRDRVRVHQRLDGFVRELRRRHRAGGPVFFWTWPIVDRRPAARRARLRRAGQPLPGRRLRLPMVQATVEPDARLVHGLVLLLGPGRDGECGRRDRRLRRRRVAWIPGRDDW